MQVKKGPRNHFGDRHQLPVPALRFFFFYFFYLQDPDSSHTRVNIGVCWWWGCLHSADLWSRHRCTNSAPKENRRFTDEGRVRQRKQKKEEQRKCEVWKFVEVLKVLKMDCHSVVGSGTSNYWVTFVAQSQFVRDPDQMLVDLDLEGLEAFESRGILQH